MSNDIEPITQEPNEHETFQQTIIQLDRSLIRSWRNAVAEIALILATMAVSAVLENKGPGIRMEMFRVVAVLLLLILASAAYNLLQCSDLRSIRNRLTTLLGMSIKQRKRADKLYGLSILDPLTGLHNRRFGEERLNQEITRAERTSDPLAVLILDLDHFKQINDQFGHLAGDLALKQFSAKLRKAIRACDVPVRIGGDEFLVILPDCPREKVDVILARLGSVKVDTTSGKIPICYSVGRAQYQVSDTIKTILGRADNVLYAEKERRSKASQVQADAWKRSVSAFREEEISLPVPW